MKRISTKKHNLKKALLLEYFTIAWNVVEGIVSITIGIASGSVSLFAFGLESSIEVFSSTVTVWQLKGNGREKSSLKMISVALLAVAVYIAFNAVKSFLDGHRPKPTIAGIVVMFLITVTMFFVGSAKRKLGLKMRNKVILAESNFTLLDSALSGSILCGLVLNTFFGLWWIDPLLALVIAANAFRSGLSGVATNFKPSPLTFASSDDK